MGNLPPSRAVAAFCAAIASAISGIATAQSSGWTPPADASMTTQPATDARVLVDRQGTAHTFFLAIPGTGRSQLFHSYRTATAGSWTSSGVLSTPGNSGQPVPSSFQFRLDSAGVLHCWFEKVPGIGSQQIYHRSLDTTSLSSGWTAAVNVSNTIQPAVLIANQIDSNRALHVFFRAIPGTGLAQLHHSYRTLAATTWTTPVTLIAGGASAVNVVGGHVQTDSAGRMHVAFEQIGTGQQVQEIWHSSLDTNNLGAGWSSIVKAGPAGLTRCNARRMVIDQNRNVHLFYTTIPTFGGAQLVHTFRSASTGSWTSSFRVLSTAASTNIGAELFPGGFAQDDRNGRLHCWFLQLAGATGIRQIWHRTLSTANPSSAWSAPVDVSGTAQPAEAIAVQFDSARRPHVFFRAIPIGMVTGQIHHARALTPTTWSTPVVVRSPNAVQGATGSSRGVRLAANGRLHLWFEQIPFGGSGKQVWHSELDPNASAPTWSVPARTTQVNQFSTLAQGVVDANGVPHTLFDSSAFGVQLYHSYRSPTGWTGGSRLSTPGNLSSPMTRPTGFLQTAADGDLHAWFIQVPSTGGGLDVWHRRMALDRPDWNVESLFAPSTPTRGTLVTLSGQVRNVGLRPAASTTIRLALASHAGVPSIDSDFVLGSVNVPALPINGLHVFNTQVAIPDEICCERAWTLNAIADPGNAVREADEANNRRTRSMTPRWPTSAGAYVGKLVRDVDSADANDRWDLCSRIVGGFPAGTVYLFGMGCTGRTPGTPIPGAGLLPLNVDACTDVGLGLFGTQFINMNAPQSTAAAGSQGYVRGGPWLATGLGLTIDFAAVYIDGQSNLFGVSQNALSMTVR